MPGSSKKNKRKADTPRTKGASKGSKRSKAAGVASDWTLRVVEDAAAPVVAQFPGGAGAVEAQLLRSNNPRKPRQRMLIVHGAPQEGSSGRSYCLAFEGRSWGAQPTAVAHHRYMVGVVDHASSTVELRPTTRLYRLEQCVHGAAPPPSSGVGGSTPNAAADYEQYQRLISAFGSRKQQQRLKSRAANRVEVANTSGASGMAKLLRQREQEASVASAAEPEVAAVEATRREQLPPYDAAAQTAMDVYKPSALITRAEWEALERQLAALLDGEDESGGEDGGAAADADAAPVAEQLYHRKAASEAAAAEQAEAMVSASERRQRAHDEVAMAELEYVNGIAKDPDEAFGACKIVDTRQAMHSAALQHGSASRHEHPLVFACRE
eukprot:g7308.t1